mmetsp:Transcript_51617/g.131377  ORF Transcript_51617/g.131377 Transcript_51617/m.131377 type:complete len:255 (-) Transcript_51617:2123-2887(-)
MGTAVDFVDAAPSCSRTVHGRLMQAVDRRVWDPIVGAQSAFAAATATTATAAAAAATAAAAWCNSGVGQEEAGTATGHVDAETSNRGELQVSHLCGGEPPRTRPGGETGCVQRQRGDAERGLNIVPAPAGVVQQGAHELKPSIRHICRVASSEQRCFIERVLRHCTRQHLRRCFWGLMKCLHEGLMQPARKNVHKHRVRDKEHWRGPNRAHAGRHQHALHLLEDLGRILLRAEARSHLSQQEVRRMLHGQPWAW